MKISSKLSTGLLMLTLLSACGPDSDGTKSVEAKFEQNVLSDGGLSTKYAKQDVVECSLEDLENNELVSIGKDANIRLNKELSIKVLRNLELKSKIEKITPEKFWEVLDSDIKKELNEYIVEMNIKADYVDFKKMLIEVAFAFTVLLENQQLEYGYLLEWKGGDKLNQTSITFTNDSEEIRKISPCEGYSFKDIKTPLELLKPSDISSRILCKNEYSSVSIDGYKNKILSIDVNSSTIDELFVIEQKDLKVRNKRRSRVITYRGEFNYKYIKLFGKKFKRRAHTMNKLSLEFLSQSGKKTKIKNLKCYTQKKLVLVNN